VNTIGFKSGRITFSEAFVQTVKGTTQPSEWRGGTNPMQIGLGMTVSTMDTLFGQGNLESTGKTTDLAIEGDGMFIVHYNGRTLYTRSGAFQFDADGRLVMPGTGAVVQGKMANATGVIGAKIEDIKLPFGQKTPAQQTSKITFVGNLAANATAGSAGPPPVPATEVKTNVTVFDSLGNKHVVTIQFTKTANANEWAWKAMYPDGTDITNQDGTILFNTDGSIQTVTGNTLSIDPNDPKLNGGATPVVAAETPLDIELSFGTETAAADIPGKLDGLGQAGTISNVAVTQDGYEGGLLTQVSIDEKGEIIGSFSNGTVRTLAQIVLAVFNNSSGLTRVGGSLFDRSGNSGDPFIGAVGEAIQGKIVSGSLEQSNVDLAEEFTKMIIAQRGFQANARVITTSDEFLTEVVNLKR
jgi:flagellar hook protein FlgE